MIQATYIWAVGKKKVKGTKKTGCHAFLISENLEPTKNTIIVRPNK